MQEYKRKQRAWHDAHYSTYEPPLLKAGYTEYYYRTVEHRATLDLLRQARFPPSRRPVSLLISCAGGGDDLVFWASQFPVEAVCGLDLSIEACRRARRFFGGRLKRSWFIQADAEALPFADNSFDLAIIHNGLHHLVDPALGLRELWRVSRYAVAVVEPADTLLMPLFIRLGIARVSEESGNRVIGFRKEDFLSFLNADYAPQIYYRRYFWYEHDFFCSRILPRFNQPAGLFLLRLGLSVVNRFFFFLRTKSAAVIVKPVEETRGAPGSPGQAGRFDSEVAAPLAK